MPWALTAVVSGRANRLGGTKNSETLADPPVAAPERVVDGGTLAAVTAAVVATVDAAVTAAAAPAVVMTRPPVAR
ncbi:MAG: hypothetical protein ACTHOD_15775 [Motilibacteraceae bacterium]